MPLESATYISDFVTSNPAASDGMNNADDHMRLIKSALKNTFPAVVGAATRGPLDGGTHGFLADQGSPATPGFAYLSKPTLGFYAIDFANNVHGFTGTLRGNGAVPAGEISDFGGPSAPTGWLVCDGQAVSRTTYADLFGYIGTIWGAGDGSTTFNVPNLMSRFRRHRDGNASFAGAVGTLKSPTNLSHTHGVVGGTGFADTDHTHSGTTGAMNQNASHTHTSNAVASQQLASSGNDGPFGFPAPGTIATINATNTDHNHNFTTGGMLAQHAHGINFTSAATGDANEARPYSATVLTCIKA